MVCAGWILWLWFVDLFMLVGMLFLGLHDDYGCVAFLVSSGAFGCGFYVLGLLLLVLLVLFWLLVGGGGCDILGFGFVV